jgi:hypothetical protein
VSDRTLRGLIGLVLAGLVAVVVAGAVLGTEGVARDLRDRTRTALAAAGLEDVLVDFSGREAELRGGNDVEIRRAEALVETLPGVRGVRVVRVEIVEHPIVPGTAGFELDRAGDDVEISGVVPTPDDAAAIKVGVAEGLRSVITGDVTVDRSVDAAPWASALPDVLDLLAGVEGLELDIPGDGSLTVGGTVRDVSERDRLAERLAEILPGLTLVDELDITPASPTARP